MNTRIPAFFRPSVTASLRRVVGGLVVTASLIAAAGDTPVVPDHHAVPATLVRLVRNSTRQFLDVNAATAAGYGPFLGCVSGPDHGAMGIHYVNLGLFGDGEIDGAHPEALIYEPVGDRRRLVGVEYLVDAATWLAAHDNAPRCSKGKFSSWSRVRIASTCPRSSSCTFGPGARTPRVHS